MFVMVVLMMAIIQMYYTMEPKKVVRMINVCDDGDGYPDVLHNGACFHLPGT